MSRTTKLNYYETFKQEREKYSKAYIYGGGMVTTADKQNLKRYKRYLRKHSKKIKSMCLDTKGDLQSQIATIEKELSFYYNKLGLTPEERQVQFQLELNLKNLQAALTLLG